MLQCRYREFISTLDEDGGQVPAVWRAAGRDAVLGQRNHRAVVEHRQQHDQQRGEVPAGESRGTWSGMLQRSMGRCVVHFHKAQGMMPVHWGVCIQTYTGDL